MFDCDKCGLCCQNIGGNPIYADLDNGKGTCRHFDTLTNLCKIYAKRPLKCRIDEAYERWFKNSIGLQEYYKLNHEACHALKNDRRK